MCLTVTGTSFKQSEFPLAKQQIFSRFPGTSMVCEIIILLSVAVLTMYCIIQQWTVLMSNMICNKLFSRFPALHDLSLFYAVYYCCIHHLDQSVHLFFQSSGSYDIRQLKRSFWNFEKEHTTTDKLTISYNSYSRNRQQQQK